MGELLAGVGRTKITPPVGTFLFGYIARERGAEAVHDDLFATALVLDDGRIRIAVVSCDLLMLHPTTVAAIRERVHAQTGIPARNVMLCCSHTHSGPVTFVVQGGRGGGGGGLSPSTRPTGYVEGLAGLIAGAVVEAARDLGPAAWGVGRGKAEIGVNRRQRSAGGAVIIGADPEGVVDRDLLILRVDRVTGDGVGGDAPSPPATRPLALLVNCACHAVCLSGNSYLVSADWPGAMRRAVEARTGAAVCFVQGACADTNPLGGPQDTFDSAQ